MVVEFQTRDLMHAHIILIVKNARSPEDYDKLVCAEIPSFKHPKLRKLVLKHMILDLAEKRIHTAVARKELVRKIFLRILTRRSPGETGKRSYPTANGHAMLPIDNQCVVPDNAGLLLKYQTHLNVEICSTIKVIKYLYKCLHKRPDRVVFAIVPSTENSKPQTEQSTQNR